MNPDDLRDIITGFKKAQRLIDGFVLVRRRARLTQNQLEHRAGLYHGTINSIEKRNIKTVRYDTIIAIAEVLLKQMEEKNA